MHSLYTCTFTYNIIYMHDYYFDMYVGTSPMIWRKLTKGAHTVTVKADCIINSVAVSTTKRKFTFTVE